MKWLLILQLLLSECWYTPKIHVEILMFNVVVLRSRAFRRLLSYECEACINRISAFIKKASQSPLASCALCRCNEKSVTQNRALTWPSQNLDLRLLTSRNVRNKFLFFIYHPVYGILFSQRKWTKTEVIPTNVFAIFIPFFLWIIM